MLPLGNCFWRAACAKAAYLTEELCSPQRKTYKKTAMSQLTNHIPDICGTVVCWVMVAHFLPKSLRGELFSACCADGRAGPACASGSLSRSRRYTPPRFQLRQRI